MFDYITNNHLYESQYQYQPINILPISIIWVYWNTNNQYQPIQLKSLFHRGVLNQFLQPRGVRSISRTTPIGGNRTFRYVTLV